MNIYLVYNKKIKAFIYFFVNFDAFGVRGYGSKMGLQATPLHSPLAKISKWRSFGTRLVRLGHVKTTSCFAASLAFY